MNDTMGRRTRPGTALAAVAFGLGAAAGAGAAEPEWTILKPSNTGIPGDYVHAIFVDADDRPWITAFIPFWEEGGVARFEGETWRTVSNVDHPEIISPRFNDIVPDGDDVLWFASDHGLLRYDRITDEIQRYDPDNSPMPAYEVENIAIAPDGTIWMAQEGLIRFDPALGVWDIWTTANGLPWGDVYPTYNWFSSVAVVPGAHGGYTVWFGSDAIGAATYEDGEFFWYGDDVPPGGPVTPTGFLSRDPVDNAGNIWLETNYGVARRAPDGTFLVTGYPPGLPPGEFSTMWALRDGRAGFGTYGGEVFLFNNGWSYLGNWGSGNHTYALAQETGGAIWAGGIGGAARYENGSWQRYRLTNTGMVGYSVKTIDFDDQGNVYMNGTAAPGVGGFSVFDGRRWTCVNDYNYGLGPVWGQPSDHVEVLFARGNGDLALDVGVGGLQAWDGESYWSMNPQYHTFELQEDTLGRLWSGNWGRLFLYENGGMTMFDENNSPMLGFEVESIVADQAAAGFVWVATGLGIVHTDGVTWNVYPREMLDLTAWSIGHFVTYAEPAGDGTLWVATGLGLYHFDPATQEYVVYTTGNSALPTNDVVFLEVTPDGSVWVSTFDNYNYPYPGGLTRFDGEVWQTWTMTDSPLPQNQMMELTSRATPTGYEVWVGTAGNGVAVLSVETATPGDLDGDGVVGILDFLALLAAWGPCVDCGGCPADLDGDCAVGIIDLLILLGAWG